jgi:hypothetical protein
MTRAEKNKKAEARHNRRIKKLGLDAESQLGFTTAEPKVETRGRPTKGYRTMGFTTAEPKVETRGRPRKYHTQAEADAAKKTYKAKFKNISIDADLLSVLNRTADLVESEWGFRPTLSQIIRHMIKKIK